MPARDCQFKRSLSLKRKEYGSRVIEGLDMAAVPELVDQLQNRERRRMLRTFDDLVPVASYTGHQTVRTCLLARI